MAEAMRVTVAYAAPGIEAVVEVDVDHGATLADAVAASGLAGQVPGFDAQGLRTGVWGKLKGADTPLKAGDRVELYRPLKADPNAARQARVAKKRAAGRA